MKNDMTRFKFVPTFVLSVLFLAFVSSCQRNDIEEVYKDESMAVGESQELEDCILAALDLKSSIKQLETELQNVDLKSIKVTLDSKGNKIMCLPISKDAAEKLIQLNIKKQALFEKYPEFEKTNSKLRTECLKLRMNNSERIAKKMSDCGFINKIQPRLKTGEENSFSSQSALTSYIDGVLIRLNCQEVAIYAFQDGTFFTCIESTNTDESCSISLMGPDANGKYYYKNNPSPILYVAHTHLYSSDPSSCDGNNQGDECLKRAFPGVDFRILYNGAYYSF